jgi:hypothetical protein
MMKLLKYILSAVVIVLAATGCIRKEPLNAECDITGASLPDDILLQSAVINNEDVTFYVKKGTDVTALAPEFILTEGATIDPPSGTVRNFETPQTYTVTSEDGLWHKDYLVTVTLPPKDPDVTFIYNFENVRLQTSTSYNYDIFYEVGADGNESFAWSSGNAGFALTGQGKEEPSTFPTYQVDEGRDGKCLALTTRNTGYFGRLRNSPLAAGSLFMGEFSVNLTNTLLSTHFGRPFFYKPLHITGYYKYTPGETYYKLNKDVSSKLEEVPGKVDEFNIYAVLFERTADTEYLTGVDVLTSPNLVAVAKIDESKRVAADNWTPFYIEFEYLKELDADKLAAGNYSFTMVFSSSADGDNFSGAPGSTLLIDQVVLTCEDEN